MDGEKLLSENFKHDFINKKAKGVILFIGDGMGPSTVTAARILEGQLKGMPGKTKNLLKICVRGVFRRVEHLRWNFYWR